MRYLFLLAIPAFAQSWTQWGQNPRHSGAVNVVGQRQTGLISQYAYDHLADRMRADFGGNLLTHYMAPLVDGDEVYTLTRGESTWVSCRSGVIPCGTQRWNQMEWGVTKLQSSADNKLDKQWSFLSNWKPAPNNSSGWEPVFHPALYGDALYVPAEAGMVMKVDRKTGELLDCFHPFPDEDLNRVVVSPLTIDGNGVMFYTVIDFDPQSAWGLDVRGAFLVKLDTNSRESATVSFAELIADAPVGNNCVGTFSGQSFPWPPSANAKPPATICGSQRPPMNAAPAVGNDGVIFIASRAHFNEAYSYLVAVNPDLTLRWKASLRDRLDDGCDVLLPPSGTMGGCRAGSTKGVDPTTNDLPAGRISDQSTASPVIAPDGSIVYGTITRYNYSRGHLMRFSSTGEYLSAYDFGWDITPAIYEHDDTWSVIVKDNTYPVGSYCGLAQFCGQAQASYSLTSLTPDLKKEWSYLNTNDQLCERQADDSIRCEKAAEPGFEWCVNMVAVDRDGVVYANSEDGNVYAIDRTGNEIGRLFLKVAIGAAYTPLAIGPDGRIYTQNDGVLFVTGESVSNLGLGTRRP